jgi:hypothetical protein
MGAQVEATLALLRDHIEGEGGPLGEALLPASEPAGPASFAALVARGPRAKGSEAEYAMVVESILEGYLLHHGHGRILDPTDPDLRLLAGDYLYAFGLARLTRLGDLEAVEELADLISLCARAHAAAGGPEDGEPPWKLTGALWALATLAIGGGSWVEHLLVKRQARDEGTGASQEVLDVVRDRARLLGLDRELGLALIGFDRVAGGEFSRT